MKLTEHVRAVHVEDALRVEWDGTHWWASSPAGVVDSLTWSKNLRTNMNDVLGETSPYDFEAGILHVQTVTMDTGGTVVDCQGYVVPDGRAVAPDIAPL